MALIVVFCFLPLYSSDSTSYLPLTDLYKNVRVLLKKNVLSATIYSVFDVKVFSQEDTAGVILKGTIKFYLNNNSLIFTDRSGVKFSSYSTIRITPINIFNVLEIDSVKFRGAFDFIPADKNGNIAIVNILLVEDYLKGVLPYEMGKQNRAKLEALKAQAVAARTYTYKKISQRTPEKIFDVNCDISDQVYNGVVGEYSLSDRAIRETEGIVAMFNDSLVDCYYHSTCGGYTASMNDVWPNKNSREYLSAIADSDSTGVYCSVSKYFNWNIEWDYESLNKIVKKYLPIVDSTARNCGDIKNIYVKNYSDNGRIKELVIDTKKGEHKVYCDQVRWVLRRNEKGNPILYSSYFKIISQNSILGKPQKFLASGKGWGHGIGMCQVGAMEMSKKGYSFEKILKHYYSGVSLVPR